MQWGQFLAVDKVELLDEEDEMFEAGVQMGLLTQLHHFFEMLMVNVGIDSEKALQDCFCNGQEILWERNACKEEHIGMK